MLGSFRATISALPHLPDSLEPPPALLLHHWGDVQMFYAPFEYVNPKARVVLVGITPGPTQMARALNCAREDINAAIPDDQILRRAKMAASFSGSMRNRLVRMLDQVELNHLLDIQSTTRLFEAESMDAHFTSCIRHPAFNVVAGGAMRPYRGTPDMARHTSLRACLTEVLLPELSAVPNAVIVPMGATVETALRALGGLDPARVVEGLPHPSGANGHYNRMLSEATPRVRDQLRSWFSHH